MHVQLCTQAIAHKWRSEDSSAFFFFLEKVGSLCPLRGSQGWDTGSHSCLVAFAHWPWSWLWSHCVYSSFGFLYPTTETVSLVFLLNSSSLFLFHFRLFSCVWVRGLLFYLPHVWTTFPFLCLILSIFHHGRFLHYCWTQFCLCIETLWSMYSFLDTRFVSCCIDLVFVAIVPYCLSLHSFTSFKHFLYPSYVTFVLECLGVNSLASLFLMVVIFLWAWWHAAIAAVCSSSGSPFREDSALDWLAPCPLFQC